MDQQFLTAAEVAERDGVTVMAVSKRARAGRYPGARKLDPSKQTSAWVFPADCVYTPDAPAPDDKKQRARS